jgi:hypothetical protein
MHWRETNELKPHFVVVIIDYKMREELRGEWLFFNYNTKNLGLWECWKKANPFSSITRYGQLILVAKRLIVSTRPTTINTIEGRNRSFCWWKGLV